MIKNVLEYFEQTLLTKKDKVAVVDDQRQISFGDMAGQAWSVGTHLLQSGVGIKHPVAVFLPKSIESIVADVGIIYSGNAYMNLDVKTPLARISNILQLVEPAFVITDKKFVGKLGEIFDKNKILLIENLIVAENKHDLLLQNLEKVIDTDPLCLINTSGSTGTPKSVVLNHKSFIDYTTWAITATGLRDDEVFGSLAPIVFDHSSYELCLLMVHGCTMVIIPETYTIFPTKLVQYCAEMHITYIFWVPTIMVNIANMDLLSRIPWPELRMVWFAGEVFPTKQFNYWRRHFPNAKFVNLYGPTEITVDCTYYIVNRDIPDNEPIPIGYPCRNTDILILDADNKLVTEKNIEGELCVRGTSLAMGYYNNPEKTAAAFVQNPLNKSYPELIYRTGDVVYVNDLGEIVYKGRNDSLIKHMGKRIELGEIEHVIVNTLQLVKNGCAVYDYGKKEIVFFYEADSEITVADLRKQIGTTLPAYMVPTRYVYQQLLPRNTNGKIDRLKLKESINNV
ncbi:MAG: amino acid adenylation domain-containing protein [Phascolarctobacterium sp.]|nr:amino acid adenylation domain-containing protein [Candidatus Phascolarctobacterium caballi]